MRNNKVAVRKVDKKNEMHEKLRRELVHSVAEELIEDPNKFLLFANIAIHETPWEVVKDKYFFVLQRKISMRKILRAMVLAEKMQTLQTECFRFLRSLMW